MIRKFLVIALSIFLLLPLSVSAEMEIFKIGYVVVEKILKEAPQTAASNKKLEKEFKSRTDGLQNKVKAITPVPGGVGPMTIACLLKNTLECFKAR